MDYIIYYNSMEVKAGLCYKYYYVINIIYQRMFPRFKASIKGVELLQFQSHKASIHKGTKRCPKYVIYKGTVVFSFSSTIS